MKSILVSTAVYAAIWSHHREGDETENDILKRLLEVSTATTSEEGNHPIIALEAEVISSSENGYSDIKNGVHFEEGQEIFRNYKGANFRARATKGYWLLLNDRKLYPSLHKLSVAVVNGHENAWNNWKFSKDGHTELIDKLRPVGKVLQRGRAAPTNLTLKDLGLE